MSKVWVVVADSSRARVLESPNRVGPLTEVESLQNPEARAMNKDLNTDKPGRSFDSAGQGRHAMEPGIDAKQVEAIQFARRLRHFLKEQSEAKKFNKLVLAAAPDFLGLLRDNLDKVVREKISVEQDKDLVKETPEKIRESLPDFLY